MASPAFGIHATTAAELIHYTSYNKPGPGGTSEQCWTRFSSANEEFNVVAAGGHQYLIQFDKNFSKKHLLTFSKKVWKTDTEKYLQSLKPGQAGQDQENWNRAQKQLLDNKILKNLGIRSGRGDEAKCKRCGHPEKNNPNGTGHSNNTGLCQVPGCNGATCVGGYLSDYIESRRNENKPDIDPYAGAGTQQSSCIVLNWIPKNEFEAAVALSIQIKDPGGLLVPTPAHIPGQPLPPLYKLKWTFVGRAGAVRHATAGAIDLDNGTWCEVGARKIAGGPHGIHSTWVIQHWEGQG